MELKLKPRWSNLAAFGMAAQYFPEYVNERVCPHSLDVLLFSVILSGHGWHYLGANRHVEAGSSVAVTVPPRSHSIVTAPGQSMAIMNLYFDPERLALPALPEEPGRHLALFWPAMGTPGKVLRIEFPEIAPVAQAVFGIERELRERRPGYPEAAAAYLKVFLLECCRRVAADGVAELSPDAGAERIARLCRHLAAHYAEPHTLDALAAYAGLQKNYLCRAFRRHTGVTISGYLLDLRLRHAMRLLAAGREKVIAVAWECGFRDCSYFNRVFRVRTGVSPARYRHASPDGGA